MYPTRMNGCENDGATEFFRQVYSCCGARGAARGQDGAAKRQLHPTQASAWKRQAIEGMAGGFLDKVKKAENKDGEIKEFHARIAQLAVEMIFYHND